MTVYIIGAGCGDEGLMTSDAISAVENCGIVIGVERLIKKYEGSKRVFYEYRAEKIKKILETCDMDAAVFVSGDTGIYSAAESLCEALCEYDLKILPGISTVSYFSSRVRIPWQDWKIISIHGRKTNVIGHIVKNRHTFVYLNNGSDMQEICEKLELYGLNDIKIFVGENLSYPDEKITAGKVNEIKKIGFSGLAAALFVNKNNINLYSEIRDGEFIRGNTPMTKSEIRTVSLSKMGLKKDLVLYDVGSGTGSVSVAAALTDPDIRVYAIEKNEEALSLTKANKIKFAADNITVVAGDASEVIKTIDEEPDCVFIGGSGGKLEEIVSASVKRNDSVRFVLNAITPQTLAETLRVCEKFKREPEILQIFSARGEKAGNSTIMKAVNPVYIIKF